MGVLTGVLRVVLAAGMTVVRLLPLLVIVVILMLLWRRSAAKSKDPTFRGKVRTVRYRDVEEPPAPEKDQEDAP